MWIILVYAVETEKEGTKSENEETRRFDKNAHFEEKLGVVLEGKAHIHNYEAIITKEPTCGEPGTKTYFCICGEIYTEEIPETGEHKWNEWKIIVQPYCSGKGLEQRICTFCGKNEEQEIPENNIHNWSSWSIKKKAKRDYGDGYDVKISIKNSSKR